MPAYFERSNVHNKTKQKVWSILVCVQLPTMKKFIFQMSFSNISNPITASLSESFYNGAANWA